MKRLILLPLLLVATLLAGCDTFDRRSKEKAATFESLSPEEREKLRRGVIELGNTPDMVYIALGRPDQRRESDTGQGREMTWIYNTYHREYEGNFHSGYRRILVYDPVRKRYLVYYEPIYTDVYSEHEEEHIRIIFRDGRVVAIEQPKPRA
ncbi:MAG TPA: hypothetical protein VNR00_16995 [Opitutus sp.]|nr:hypothetical protein [Opitutus sp.]